MKDVVSMDYIGAKDTADKWGITRRRVQLLCEQGRIPGAKKIGTIWIIPDDAVKPNDERIKSGKYIKPKEGN